MHMAAMCMCCRLACTIMEEYYIYVHAGSARPDSTACMHS